MAPRVRFENQSAFELREPDRSFDLTVNRHMLHGAGARHAARRPPAPDPRGLRDAPLRAAGAGRARLRHEGPPRFGAGTNTDLFIGRHVHRILADLGLRDIMVDYVVVDTVRVPRETFAAIIEAWRDGYVESVAQYTRFTEEQARAYFDAMIANILDPKGYAVWMAPVVSAIVP